MLGRTAVEPSRLHPVGVRVAPEAVAGGRLNRRQDRRVIEGGRVSYQAEKFSVARSCLMLPHPQGEEASIASAFAEIDHGLHRFEVPDDFSDEGVTLLRKLKQLMSTEGLSDPHQEGLYTIRARGMNVDERHTLSRLVDDLAFLFEEYDREGA